MEIHRTRRPVPLFEAAGGKRRSALLVAYTLGVLFLGAWLYRSGIVDDAIFSGRAAVSNQVRKVAARLASDPVELRLDLDLEDYLALAAKREEALRRNLLVAGPDDFVPARIRSDEENLRVKVRLKGDLRDHWAGDKWSLRVRVSGEESLFGMKQFSLQHPGTRGYLSEWVYHEALRREGLPALRYQFVRLVLNGKDMGIYALEEHFEKRLVENNRLREGPVVRFSEDLSWIEASRQGFLKFRDKKQLGGAGSYLAAEVDSFQTSRWVEDEAGYETYRRALGVLDGFRNGSLTTSEAFDARKLARFLAVTELLGSAHAAGWRNMRFYFNPVTSLLEPVGFDAGGHGLLPEPALVYTIPRVYAPDKDDVYHYNYSWFDALFADRAFYVAYVGELERVSTADYVRSLLVDIDPGIRENLEILHTEFPEQHFSPQVLWENRAYIVSMLDPARALLANLVEARTGGARIAVGNIQFLPVEVLGIEVDGELVGRPDEGPLVLEGRDPKRPVELTSIAFRFPDEFEWRPELAATLQVRHRMLGVTPLRRESVQPEAPLRRDLAAYAPLAPTVRDFEFLEIDDDLRTITVVPGAWTVASDIVVPSGWTFVCGAGTTLDLIEGAALVSRSPLRMIGTAEEPVVVSSSDGRGQGVVVLGAGRTSDLVHVRFESLTTPSRQGWQLTGAVTFYESPLRAKSCAFIANTCEDALNTIRTSFELDSCLFENTFSDAFDSDFCDGVITDCSFVEPGNDGVDVSGSYVEIERLFVTGAEDKGLSAGEDSVVRAREVRVEDSFIGLASKDYSQLRVEGATIVGCRYGLSAYRKKPEFGSSRIEVIGLEIEATEELAIIEIGSRATVDGERIDGDRANVYVALYGAEG